jgi:Zn-dependent protease with chaperone function
LKQSDFDYTNRKGRYEILGIVAHELGHWANMDTFKLLAISLTRLYIIFFAFSYSIKYTDMPNDFGFSEESVFLSLLLFFQLLEPLMEALNI